MTLLARAADVPARVAIGYRVAEENPSGITGSFVNATPMPGARCTSPAAAS